MIPKVTVVIGTRPEAIKLAPIILELKKNKTFLVNVVLTGQHQEMVSQVFELFDIKENLNLKIMKEVQSINYITREILIGLQEHFNYKKPDLILVQGDTSTSFAAALAAYYEKIPIGHVEAGLRTNNIFEPFPEEANRRMISQIATLNFAPTDLSKQNLLDAGVNGKIIVTGNSVIDSLIYISNKISKSSNIVEDNIILATTHRRENWGIALESICEGFKLILKKHTNYKLILPMHPNLQLRKIIERSLKNHPRVSLIEPLRYDELISLIKRSKIILTDSGGLQEEAPALGKPVLVLRQNTERTEALLAGTVKLVGTNSNNIFRETDNLLSNENEYNKMSNAKNPYGDGNTSKLIVDECKKFLKLTN